MISPRFLIVSVLMKRVIIVASNCFWFVFRNVASIPLIERVMLYFPAQVLATLWNHSQLQQQMKSEGWKYDATKSADLARAPLDYEATSLPRTPDERHRPEARRNRTAGDDDKWRGSSHRASGNEYHGEPIGSNDLSSESDRQRSWGDSMNQIPPPYVSDDNYSRGSRSRDEMPLEDMNSSSRPSAAGSERDETDSRNERTLKLNDSGGGGEKDDDLWV